jgi:hypothetical protein
MIPVRNSAKQINSRRSVRTTDITLSPSAPCAGWRVTPVMRSPKLLFVALAYPMGMLLCATPKATARVFYARPQINAMLRQA